MGGKFDRAIRKGFRIAEQRKKTAEGNQRKEAKHQAKAERVFLKKAEEWVAEQLPSLLTDAAANGLARVCLGDSGYYCDGSRRIDDMSIPGRILAAACTKAGLDVSSVYVKSPTSDPDLPNWPAFTEWYVEIAQ